ncbi:hypothetical protein MCUN1_000309 [Malassezia cuniculi]|uniref:Transmembrane protein 115 n=1 Tax=Malassezia cuniculi TaxID=948313 RepID=A0AAF0J9P1_9BASI|nr:hypothetical protein MCUN1_000309 [Malassezia cuniculi]
MAVPPSLGSLGGALALPGTRIICGLLFGLSGLLACMRVFEFAAVRWYQAPQAGADGALAYPYLVIVPGESYIFPWTLISAALCETTIIEFIISAISVPLASQYLERQWGATELLNFSVIVVGVSNAIAWIAAVALYIVTGSSQVLNGTQYHGMQALQTGYLVAFVQLVPQNQVQLLGGRYSVSVKDLPMLYVGLSNVMCIIGRTSPFILIQFGWLVSWVYLRFYQRNAHGGRGDCSDSFAFIHWFPPFVHPVVSVIARTVYGVCRKLRLVPEHTPMLGEPEIGLQLNSRAEAERRRALALAALDNGAPGVPFASD